MRRIYLRRWSTRSKLSFVLAIACGVGAFATVHSYAARLDALEPVAGPRVRVVVATRFLPRGTVLTDDALRVAEVPVSFAEPGAIRSVEEAVGATLVADIAEEETVTRTRVGSVGGPIATQVPAGLRAFTVPSGMPSGSVRPGDRVDVLATFGGPRPYTDTVGSELEVVSVIDGEGEPLAVSGTPSGPTLVLLVTPDAAERLAQARAFAELTVTVVGIDAAVDPQP
jgi:Flp pilus assembly protein CpaB